jgi:hypothetical protein
MPETVEITLAPGMRERMEVVGFPCTWQEVLQFLVEEGLNVIEKHRTAPTRTN